MSTSLLMGIMILLTAAGQVAIRTGARRLPPGRPTLPTLHRWINPFLVLGLALALAAPLPYFVVLSKVPLARAYGFTALSHVAVLLAGRMVLGERLAPTHIVGGLCIASGLLIWNL